MSIMEEGKHVYRDTIKQLLDIFDGLGEPRQQWAEQFIWYSIGELICCCNDNSNSDGGYDLCGYIMFEFIGNNRFCHEVINSVRDNEPEYVQTMSKMAIQETVADLGQFWLRFMREGEDAAIVQFIVFLRLYSDKFLPVIKHLIDDCCLKIYPNYYSNAIAKETRIKRKTANALIQKLAGYIETKDILTISNIS